MAVMMTRERLLEALEEAKRSRDAAEGRIVRLVARARVLGASWADIGTALGTTRQSAHERYAAAAETLTAKAREGILREMGDSDD